MRIFVDANAIKELKNSDCLSISTVIFRNGGRTSSGPAIAFSDNAPDQLTNAWTEEVDKLRDQNRRMLATLKMYLCAGIGNSTSFHEQAMASAEARAIIKEVEGNG